MVGTRIAGICGVDQRKRGMSRFGSCYYTARVLGERVVSRRLRRRRV